MLLRRLSLDVQAPYHRQDDVQRTQVYAKTGRQASQIITCGRLLASSSAIDPRPPQDMTQRCEMQAAWPIQGPQAFFKHLFDFYMWCKASRRNLLFISCLQFLQPIVAQKHPTFFAMIKRPIKTHTKHRRQTQEHNINHLAITLLVEVDMFICFAQGSRKPV